MKDSRKAQILYQYYTLSYMDGGKSENHSARLAAGIVNDQIDRSKRTIRRYTKKYRDENGNVDISSFDLPDGATDRDLEDLLEEKYVEPDRVEEEMEIEIDKQQLNELMTEENYVYNEDDDVYVVFLPSLAKPINISGSKHRAMKRAYSNWDEEASTINEIIRAFPFFNRNLFREYKTIFGWTHDSSPFSKEETLEKDEDTLVDQGLQLKEQAIHTKLLKKRWSKTKKKSNKWDKLEVYFKEPIEEMIQQYVPQYTPPSIEMGDVEMGEYALIISPTDLHYGKQGWCDMQGKGYDREMARERLLGKTKGVIKDASMRGRPEKIIACVGSDWLHIDNLKSATTKGTPQDTDGTPAEIFFRSNMLAVEWVDLLRSATDEVDVVGIPGNHDEAHSQPLLNYLYAWYRNEDDVDVEKFWNHRQYRKYGNTTIGFSHGENEKKTDYGPLLMSEAKDYWADSKFGTWFLGHLHKYEVQEKSGVKLFRLPSLSGADYWHTKQGYTMAQKAICGYSIDKETGVRGSHYIPDIG